MSNKTATLDRSETKHKLLDAGIELMRARGYNATTIDDICAAAGVTKGGFFHYFKSKEDLAKAALTRFYDQRAMDANEAPFRQIADPLARIFARLDYVKDSSGGANRLTKGCLIGMIAQELSLTHPELRSACHQAFANSAEDFSKDLAAAKAAYAPTAPFEPRNVAMLYSAIIQGSMLISKAGSTNNVLLENIEQFRHYISTLFGCPPGASAISSTSSGHSAN